MNLSMDYSTGSAETLSECNGSGLAAEVLMVDTPCSHPGFCRSNGGDGDGGPSHGHEEYRPEALTSQQRDEMPHHNVEALHIPIIGETSEARALEAARLATLAECARLENLQHSLNERAR